MMLIGHGTFDGTEYKLNLPGPDITGGELAAMLERVPAGRQLVVNMTSASGGSLKALQRHQSSGDCSDEVRVRAQCHGFCPLLGGSSSRSDSGHR